MMEHQTKRTILFRLMTLYIANCYTWQDVRVHKMAINAVFALSERLPQ